MVDLPDALVTPVHEAAGRYLACTIPTVIVAGEGYGAGSARDWAAKVIRLLGVRAVRGRGFERIYRTNLVTMGDLPPLLPASSSASKVTRPSI